MRRREGPELGKSSLQTRRPEGRDADPHATELRGIGAVDTGPM